MALCDHWTLCSLLVSIEGRKMESISLFLQFDWASLGQRFILEPNQVSLKYPSLVVKNPPTNPEDVCSILGQVSLENGKTLQYSSLGNLAWWAAVHRG